MKLVDNARDFWRWHSTWAIAILAALPMVWAELPDDVKAMIPPDWRPWVALALGVAGIALRLRKQP